MVTKSSSFLVLFLTTLGMITSIIPTIDAQKVIPNDLNPMQLPQQQPIQQQQGQQSQYNYPDFQTFTKYMDMYNELYPQSQSQQPQSQQQGSNHNDFLTFIQYLQYYDQLYGQKDYILKIYNDNDDKDYKYKYKYKYKKEFEEYKNKKHEKGEREGTRGGLWNADNRYHPDYAGDDRKYCTGDGVWKDGKCHIEDDEERTIYEDTVCDDGPSKACGNVIRDIYTEKEIKELNLLDDPRYWNDEQQKKKPDYNSYEEYNEIVEPICKKHGGKINYGSGECGFDDDIDRAKSTAFEKELDNRGLGADYTAEEEASWNQKEEVEKAAKEDAKCDDEDADTTDVNGCMSEDRKNNEREWYYNENTGSYEYMTDKEIKDHNMESESGIMQGEKWGPEYKIVPPSEPYPTTEIEDWSNTVSDSDRNTNLASPVMTNIEEGEEGKDDWNTIETSTPEEADSQEANDDEPETSSEEATEQEEDDDNQVNTDTEDSSDNTDSSDSQDSSDSEDNSSDDGGDSSDSGDDSSSSDDGGDSGDSSESEE